MTTSSRSPTQPTSSQSSQLNQIKCYRQNEHNNVPHTLTVIVPLVLPKDQGSSMSVLQTCENVRNPHEGIQRGKPRRRVQQLNQMLQ
jgi:hypothetical protein